VAILVECKRKQLVSLVQRYADAHIVDVTACSAPSWVTFSPFYIAQRGDEYGEA